MLASRVCASLDVVLAVAGPVVRSGNVSSRWAMSITLSSVYHSVTGSTESDRGDGTLAALSTRVPRTEPALQQPSPKNVTSQEGTKGKAECVHTPKDVYYIQ